MNTSALVPVFQAAAVLQLGIALLNLFLVRLMRWKEDVARMPLLLREVFHVHAWFISVTLTIFGAITWRFASDMSAGTNPVLRWLATGIGLFWGIRTVLQVTYYSSSHWRRQPTRTFIHVLLLFLYGGFASVYLWSAFARFPGDVWP